MTISGLLLAGGRSKRMAQDKRLIEIDGKPLIARSYDLLDQCCDEVLVLIAEQNDEALLKPYFPIGTPFVFDEHPHEGPMGALISGLKACESEWGLLLAVDLPSMTPEFLKQFSDFSVNFQENRELFVPECNGLLQVTTAVYSSNLIDKLEKAFSERERSLHTWIKIPGQDVEVITQRVWEEWGSEDVFTNMNRAGDVRFISSAIDSQS